MENKILDFLGLIILVWLFVEGAQPIQYIKKLCKVNNLSNTENVVLLAIQKLVNCAKCSGFWFGFAYYYNSQIVDTLLMAGIVSVSAELFHRGIKKVL